MHCNNQIRTICRVVHENRAPEISTVNLTVDIQQRRIIFMKTIKYLTVFCMMICMIMQLNTNVSANENNIYVMSLTEDIRNMHQRIQFLHSKPQEKKVFKQLSVISMKPPRIKRGNVDLLSCMIRH